MSARLLVNIAYQHLRPLQHARGCAERCAAGCPVREFGEALASPVLPSEIAEERRREEQLRAFAEQFNATFARAD